MYAAIATIATTQRTLDCVTLRHVRGRCDKAPTQRLDVNTHTHTHTHTQTPHTHMNIYTMRANRREGGWAPSKGVPGVDWCGAEPVPLGKQAPPTHLSQPWLTAVG